MVFNPDSMVDGVTRFYWPLMRIAGLTMVAPIFSAAYVPMRIRVALTLAITFVLLPAIDPVTGVEVLSAQGLLISAMQLLIGVAIGLILLLVFNAVILGGESVATTMGLGYALINDPNNGVQVPIVSQFYTIFVTLIFLAFNGHHAVLQMLAGSFNYMPIDQNVSVAMLWNFLEWSGVLFYGALLVALPALAAMLTVNLIMGVMTRAAPQLNIFSVGFPVTMTVGFLVILLTLPIAANNFEQLVQAAFDAARHWLGLG